MSTYVIRMPDIGEGIAEVELVEWHIQVGDQVQEDQLLVDVMTDKAMVEIPSAVAGKVLALGGEPGQVLAVGSELVRLEVAEEQTQSPASQTATFTLPATPEQPSQHEPRGIRHTESKPLAAPTVRRRARELGVELHLLRGSGPGGRILHEDLDRHLNQGSAYSPRLEQQQIPVVGLRRKIAQRMSEAHQRIPHFSYVEEIDVTELEALRQQLNQQYAAERGKLTLLPFIARAMVIALADNPHLNAHYDDQAQQIIRYGAVHLGIATQSMEGLLVPVVRHAESLDLWACAAEIARLAEATRSGKIRREELSGSTITLSSLGALGGIVSTPLLNHPELAILGVNRMLERPMAINGGIYIRRMMNLSSSFDHRIIDGMDAAVFIQAVRKLLEHPASLLPE